jgi:hypothetical protein
MTKKNPLLWDGFANATITMGAAGLARHFVENVIDFHNLVESQILGDDGRQCKIYFLACTVIYESEDPFSIVPLIVQTNGTITDTVDLTAEEIRVNLDSAIDDVFGFKKLPNFRKPLVASRVPSLDSTSASGREFQIRLHAEVPAFALQILNKTTESERLQDIHLVVHGTASANNQVIEQKNFYYLEYDLHSKPLILR